jgi:Ser/Thr protein kinase RdoA (MazF antagonist)
MDKNNAQKSEFSQLNLDFSSLDPDWVLDALQSAGFECDGRILALNSYENRVYQLGMESGGYLVAKFYRPGRWTDAQILEEHQFVHELKEAEIPVISAIENEQGQSLHFFNGYRFSVFPSVGGRAPELDRADCLLRIGRQLGRIHQVGARSAFQARPVINPATFGRASLNFLNQASILPPSLSASYFATAELLMTGVDHCFERAGSYEAIRLHGDCHLGNILWNESGNAVGPSFLDFDDSRMGPAMQDCWMLLSGSRIEMQNQLCDFLEGYEEFYAFDPRQLHLLEALRSLRLLHYTAWLAQRRHEAAFQRAFPWFNTEHYWQDRILEMREQIALMNEGPLII